MTVEFNHNQIAETIECPESLPLSSETLRSLLSTFGESYWNYLIDRSKGPTISFGIGVALDKTKLSAIIETKWRQNEIILTLIGLNLQIIAIRREADTLLGEFLRERGDIKPRVLYD